MSTHSAIRKLPLFMAYCPDLPKALSTRLGVRARHLERWQQDKKSGRGFFGLGYKPTPTPSTSTPIPISTASDLPTGVQPMAGSLMLFHSESLSTAWERIKSDVYYTGQVWDTERIVLEEFITPPEGYLYPKEAGEE